MAEAQGSSGPLARPAGAALEASGAACLFLHEWEAARAQVHAVRRKTAEGTLYGLNVRVHSGLAALDAWLAVLEMRRKLEEVSAAATTRGVDELEARWRPVRLQAADGEAAAWLLAAERAHAAELTERSARWAAAKPAGLEELRGKFKALSERLAAEAVTAVQAWDAAHAAASQAWSGHSERLEATAQAVAGERAPPDSWLSEVRYREHARGHVSQQAAAEELLAKSATALAALEAERAQLWDAFTAAYAGAGGRAEAITVAPAEGGFPQGAPAPAPPPPLRLDATGSSPGGVSADPQGASPLMPDMPTASGAVLLRTRVAMQAPSGMFGLGGNAWREGATLVLTLHGYLHLFYFERPAKGRGEAAEGSADEDEELVEAAIRASVYVPLATRCVFLRKGKELSLDLAEAEAAEAPPQASGPAGALRRWISRAGSEAQPLPRRIQARIADAEAFSALEQRCHDFVRRGQGLRNSAAAAAVAAAAASVGAGAEAAGS